MAAMLPIDRMIDAKNGIISRDIFVSPDCYREELEKLFARTWLCIGHESQIPHPGDFFVSRMGEESVILCRDAVGAVHVFQNSCRHRGMKVCRYEQGKTSLFGYSTGGKLQGVPLYCSLCEGTLNRAECSLSEVPKLALWHGTIWASWDPGAPDFLDYLGDVADHLDQVIDCRNGRSGGAEVIGVHKWNFPSNWKFAAEHFLDDAYPNPPHRAVDIISMGSSRQRGASSRADNECAGGQRFWVGFPQVHGVTGALMPEQTDYSGPAGITEDDMEDWLYAKAASRGTTARRYPFNYQTSMGTYKANDPIRGDVSLQITDPTPRNYYRVYKSYLSGAPWDELLGHPPMRAAAE